MKNIIIFGVGDLSKQLFRYIEQDNIYEVIAFSIEEKFIESDLFCNRPVVAFERIEKLYRPDEFGILVCIGYNCMNKTRARIFKTVREKGYELLSYIHPSATILTDDIGYGCIVLENASISIGCKIGDGNIFYNNSVICHDVIIGDFNFFAPASCVLGFSTIKQYCFIGANSAINSKTIVENESLIGANSFIKNNTECCGVYVPERTIKIPQNSNEILL